MKRQKKAASSPGAPLFEQAEAVTLQEVDQLSAALAAKIGALGLAARVEALNQARAVLHEVSPFKSEPVDLVLWIPNETVYGNEYNPNSVAPPEMELLRVSIEANGYTQPIVTYPIEVDLADEGQPSQKSIIHEVVDGFHRNRCGKEVPTIRERVHGYLPVTQVRSDRTSQEDRITSTIQHNRARGVHSVDRMSDIIRRLYLLGVPDAEIQRRLGMEPDEVLRLKQITGLAALFAGAEFSKAWEPVE